MKPRLLTVLLVLGVALRLNSQTGVYSCNYMTFTSDQDPSKNTLTRETQILIIDFDAIEKKSLTWRPGGNGLSGDDLLKWNIKYKKDMVFNKEKNILQTIYVAFMELGGIETKNEAQIIKLEDYNSNETCITIDNVGHQTRWFFGGLRKM